MLEQIPLFDAHFHIVDQRFPLIENQGFLPAAFSCADYLAVMKSYQVGPDLFISIRFRPPGGRATSGRRNHRHLQMAPVPD